MEFQTRKLFNAMMEGMAELYSGHWNGADKFSIDPIAPELEQTLEKRIQETSGLLSKINVIGVRDLKGEKLGLSAGSSVAGRTNTDNSDRETQYIGELDGRDYELFKTDFDTHIKYKTIDTWSSHPSFEQMYRDKVVEQIARDRVMVGWYGESVAADTDRAANPMLQDVNIGWLKHVETDKPENYLGADASTIKIGDQAGATFKTLDTAVFDIRGSLLDPWHRNAPDLVLMVGYELWHKHNLTLIEDNTVATERNALDAWFAKEKIAGLRVVLEPFLPDRAVIVTSYDNLSIYYQKNARRRTIIDNAKRDRIEDYQSTNEGYVVEDFGKFGGIKGSQIQLPDGAGGWA